MSDRVGRTIEQLCAAVAAVDPGNRLLATTPRRLEPLLAELDVVERTPDGNWRLTNWADATLGRELRELEGGAIVDPDFGLHRRRRRAA
jgi:hypothetical protein